MPPAATRSIILRLTLSSPPVGVRWAVQLGRDELLAPTRVTRDRVDFDVPVEVVATPTGAARLRGSAVQGPASGRFLYVNSGTRAGDLGSPWNRRAKVPLTPMPTERLLAKATEHDLVLSAEIAGTAKDGGPAVASIALLRGWT
jgi:hypothetical protein